MTGNPDLILNYNSYSSPSEVRHVFEEYRQYLNSVKSLMPPGAYEFATAEWHYDPSDHRCPHDSWLESLTIEERELPSCGPLRGLTISVVLLGAYHDGQIEIMYSDVTSYQLSNIVAAGSSQDDKHIHHGSPGDWLIDEIRMSDEGGTVVHHVEFRNDAKWIIRSSDISVTWTPF